MTTWKTDKKYIISLSGGNGSAISALIAHKNNLDFELVFADTLIEDPDCYRFIKDVSSATNKQVHWLIDGRTPWQVFIDKRFIGNSRTAHCSQVLKTEQVRKWIAKNCGNDEFLVLGMDSSEQDRIERARSNWHPRKVVSLLSEFRVNRGQYAKWFAEYGIVQPSLYTYGFPHNNCGGMCVRAGLKQFATLLNVFPERFAHHANEMDMAMQKIGSTAKPFLRVTIDGYKKYVTMTQFKYLIETNQIYVDPYDWGGCACFIDEI